MDINKIADQIAAEEDFKSTVYLDTQNFPTIGYGRLLEATPMTEKEAKRKYGNLKETEKEARAKMIQYIKETAIPNAKKFIGEGFDDLSSEVQTATVSLAYNVGGSGINQFNTLRDSLKNNDLKSASQSLMGSLAGVQALFRYADIIEKSFGKENMPTPEELKANPRAAELLNFIHGRKVLGKPIPKVFEQYIDNDRIEGATVIDFLPENLQQIYNANGGGIKGAKAVQQELGVKDDGIIGPGTLRKALEDERRSKAGSYSKEEIEEDEVSFNVSEEEKEEPSFFDNIKDFFGMSAKASDVPPMETLQEPQEEVPMSPTDAMRAQSQGRVILDSLKPTNPEAGPSDTVPAMLTPGEAVIPAAAAQDPDNKPVIEKMIKEGRAKNRMAEANGVPVNGKEAIMYDDAELDAYHKRNKTGKYGGGEMSLQGFAGGTMDVPAMIMMAPPKDPAMDEMEKLALKQMGYEMKSKNRTRDTIEKIGLKHLEDTADVNMKQAALDETMRNYGLEVPMPMQPVPQGFQDGTPSLQEALSYMEQGPQQDPRMELLEADAEGRGLSYLLGGGTPVSSPEFVPPLDLVNEEQVAQNIATNIGYDPRAAQQAEAELASFKMPQEFVLEKAVVDTPKVETPTPDSDDDDNEGGFLSGLGKALGSAFKSAAKSVFDPESIATAGIYYGVNRLLGYDNATAAKQAAIGYNVGQQQRAAKLKIAADLLEKKETTQAQRDKEDIANQQKLRNAAESQFNKAFEQTLTKEGARAAYGTTPEALTGEVVAALRAQGVDMSDPLQVEYAMNLVPSVVQQYKESMQRGEEILSVQDAFDRVFRSKLEVSDALSVKDDEGVVTGVVKSGVTAPLFNQIRKNISNANTPEGQAEFESRLSMAYKLFQERGSELNLPAPGPGENEFTVFLRTVLGQGTIRDFAK